MGGTSLLSIVSGSGTPATSKANENGDTSMLEGWIAIHRLMQKWEWWDDPIMVKVWLQLLFDANISDGHYKGMPVNRGQLVFGRKAYAEKCSISEQQIRTVVT